MKNNDKLWAAFGIILALLFFVLAVYEKRLAVLLPFAGVLSNLITSTRTVNPLPKAHRPDVSCNGCKPEDDLHLVKPRAMTPLRVIERAGLHHGTGKWRAKCGERMFYGETQEAAVANAIMTLHSEIGSFTITIC